MIARQRSVKDAIGKAKRFTWMGTRAVIRHQRLTEWNSPCWGQTAKTLQWWALV